MSLQDSLELIMLLSWQISVWLKSPRRARDWNLLLSAAEARKLCQPAAVYQGPVEDQT